MRHAVRMFSTAAAHRLTAPTESAKLSAVVAEMWARQAAVPVSRHTNVGDLAGALAISGKPKSMAEGTSGAYAEYCAQNSGDVPGLK